MAKKPNTGININLSSKGKETVGKVFYKWAIDAGRAIIVGIELIALAALGYRFVIDARIVDLHDSIKREEAYIAAQTNDEKVFRSIQERLKNIKATNIETSAKVSVMNEILKAVSGGTFFSTNMTINQHSVLIDGSTFSVVTLTTFLDSIKTFPAVEQISIDEINTTSDGVRFKVRIDIKETAKQKAA